MTDKKPGFFSRLADAAQSVTNNRQFERHDKGDQLTIRIAKQKYQTLDWSIGGFRIHMPTGTVRRGDLLDGEIAGGTRRIKDRKISMRVARVQESGDVGFQITELSHDAFSALNELQAEKAVRDKSG